MLNNIRLASYTPKGKEMLTMKQQKAVLIAIIVICVGGAFFLSTWNIMLKTESLKHPEAVYVYSHEMQ